VSEEFNEYLRGVDEATKIVREDPTKVVVLPRPRFAQVIVVGTIINKSDYMGIGRHGVGQTHLYEPEIEFIIALSKTRKKSLRSPSLRRLETAQAMGLVELKEEGRDSNYRRFRRYSLTDRGHSIVSDLQRAMTIVRLG